ncbi:PilZ domain-containing protein [Shewanella fidelis]|uniref:PilZ domain-containing protein n=1 Tax=Shewanella fidelis TaxID=173509 RepID=UPI00048E6FD0|nr:PilZ domain-containing protein [Shewanella fidelis]
MTLDLHKALVEQLKPLLMEPNFQELFDQLTADETNSTRFLLKMELTRIASICTRNIDLRNKTELECEEFQYAGQRHYLDQPAKECFTEALALYRDEYTLGVYEQVINSHKQRILKQRKSNQLNSINVSESSPFVAKGVVLGSYFARSEERMNYSMRISVTQGQHTLTGITADLSVGGARVRLPVKHHLRTSQPVRMKLIELSDEYYHKDLQQGVDYQIVDIEQNQEFSWLRLKRISGSEALSEMLSNLIKGYKYRYKVNVNDVLVSTKGLGFERYYLPHLPHMPLFLEQVTNTDGEQQHQLSHKLLSRDNQGICQYFKDEDDISQLTEFLTPARIKLILESDDNSDHCQLFSFVFTAQGGKYFYTASLAELKAKNLLALFLSFAAAKPSFRIFRVTKHEIDHKQSYKACVLPGDESRYSPKTEAQLAKFSHVLQLMDTTGAAADEHYQIWEQVLKNSEHIANANELKAFGQTKVLQHAITLISLQFNERRNESRFAFKTAVLLNQGKLNAIAATDDISSRGMKLTLTEPVEFNQDEPIAISFPKLQTLAGKTSLEMLPYRLLHTRKNGVTLHLVAQVGHTPHMGVEFLNRLIKQNRERLQQLTEGHNEFNELADGMKNIAVRKLASVPYFLERTAKSAFISTLGIGTEQNHIANLFASKRHDTLAYDLSPLLLEDKLKRDFIAPIRAMKPQDPLQCFEVFIQLSRGSQGKMKLRCITATELPERKQQLNFINQSQELGEFIALRVYRGATGKPDLNYIQRERDYLTKHASHKTKKLEEQLWNIIGVGEFLDITAEVLLRFPEQHQLLNNASTAVE